jgi:hypothetical protein
MALFKKLNEQIEVSKIKKQTSTLTERESVEQELIFGNIFEDVYKVTAIGQGGTKTSYEYERDSEEAAKNAAIDGFDVPKENILKVEKMDHDKPENPERNTDDAPLTETSIETVDGSLMPMRQAMDYISPSGEITEEGKEAVKAGKIRIKKNNATETKKDMSKENTKEVLANIEE